MASYCVYHSLIPAAAATNLPPKSPVSSLHDIGGGGNGRVRIKGNGLLSGVSPALDKAIAIPSFRRRRCLFNRRFGRIKFTTHFCCNSQLAVDLAPVTAAAYGVLLTGGGLFAYQRSGSKGSLLGGLTGGSLMAAAYFLMQATDMKEIGEALAFGSSLLFASVFGIRLAATRKITPAGPLLGLSICALAVFISAYLQESLGR